MRSRIPTPVISSRPVDLTSIMGELFTQSEIKVLSEPSSWDPKETLENVHQEMDYQVPDHPISDEPRFPRESCEASPADSLVSTLAPDLLETDIRQRKSLRLRLLARQLSYSKGKR